MAGPMSAIHDDMAPGLPAMVELRHRLHRRPELGLQLPATQAAVLAELEGLPLRIETGSTCTSVVATLDGARPGPTVLLRADMDALPMPEDTGLDHASEVPGAMHACGHDAHVSMLVAAVRQLVARRDELQGRVRFMFQPGEEGFGGAQHMIDDGVLDGVDAGFAIHVTPNLPSGWLMTRPGPFMASADELFITVRGRGGHASTPHFTADPVPVACEIVGAIQTMVTRRVDAFAPAVVTIARIEAGTATNVIPETAELSGTIRAVSEATRASVHADLVRLAEGIAAAHGMAAEVEVVTQYPVTVNHPGIAALALEVGGEVVRGGRAVESPAPLMGAEDWSMVLQRIPGAMAFLGVCPPDVADPRQAAACHSNLMRMDDQAMTTGAAMHVAMAFALLAWAGD
ncbi:MAG: M20 family metallopeptidase [Acidimicrobiales bacterium]